MKIFQKETYTIPENTPYNRSIQFIPSILTHMSIGTVLSFSLLNSPLTKSLGVVASTAADWTLGQILPIASLHLFMQGAGATIAGAFATRVGPRLTCTLGAFFYGAGYALFGLGVHLHMLPLCYLGFGLISGMGLGITYTSPLSNLINWFPDRRGLASGLVLCGFGGSGILASNVMKTFLDKFAVAPQYFGTLEHANNMNLPMVNDMYQVNGQSLILATKKDLIMLPDSMKGLEEGLYYMGTGSLGLVETLCGLGAFYSAIMLSCSFLMKIPSNSLKEEYNKLVPQTQANSGSLNLNMSASQAIKTKDFYMMWTMFFVMTTYGLASLYTSANFMNEIFRPALPDYVTNNFVKNYIILLSVSNLTGRILFSTISEYLGRKNTFLFLSTGSVMSYYGSYMMINKFVADPSVAYLHAFMGLSMASISYLGGTYSLLPALESDRFGAKNLNQIHGYNLTASSMGAIFGPKVMLYFKDIAEAKHVAASLVYNEFFTTAAMSMMIVLTANLLVKDKMTPEEIQMLKNELEKEIKEKDRLNLNVKTERDNDNEQKLDLEAETEAEVVQKPNEKN